jgi:hypothetical protein
VEAGDAPITRQHMRERSERIAELTRMLKNLRQKTVPIHRADAAKTILI